MNARPASFLFLAVLGILVAALTIFMLRERTAKSTDVLGLEAEPTSDNAVRIAGLVMHSALSVKEIQFSTPDDQTIDIDLILVSGDRAPSGSFDFVIYRRPSTSRIRFGSDRAVVWKAGQQKGVTH